MEHLILTYTMTSESVERQLKAGRLTQRRQSVLEFLLRIQTLGLGYMPDGVPSMRATRPTDFTPESGREIAARFLQEAEAMDLLLVAGRRRFGIQPCGEHPYYGTLRIDEWRRYHAVHASHHMGQLKFAIKFARTPRPAAVAG